MNYAAYDEAFRQVTGRAVGVVPFSGLQDKSTPAAPARSAATDAERARMGDRRQRVRDTGNALWRKQGYRFINCPCGTTLKVPPRFPKDVVTCPNCGRDHDIRDGR